MSRAARGRKEGRSRPASAAVGRSNCHLEAARGKKRLYSSLASETVGRSYGHLEAVRGKKNFSKTGYFFRFTLAIPYRI
jgi:hypothetical protein